MIEINYDRRRIGEPKKQFDFFLRLTQHLLNFRMVVYRLHIYLVDQRIVDEKCGQKEHKLNLEAIKEDKLNIMGLTKEFYSLKTFF